MSFTPDGFPLLGETARSAGCGSAEAIWVTHSGGAGRALAELMTHGDVAARPARVRPRALRQPRASARLRAGPRRAAVPRGLRRHPPRQQSEQARGLRRDAVLLAPARAGRRVLRERRLGAPAVVRGQRAAPTTGPSARRGRRASGRRSSPPSTLACRERVGIFDLSPFTKLEVSGPGALGVPAAAGRQRGRPSARHDRLHGDALPARRDHVRPDDHARGRGPLLGRHRRRGRQARPRLDAPQPARRRIGLAPRPHLRPVLPRRLGAGRRASSWPRSPRTTSRQRGVPVHDARASLHIGYVPVRALRISYVGELGWEIYAPTEFGAALWDTLWAAGAPLGAVAVRRRRLRLAAPGEGLPAVGPGHRRGAQPLRGRPRLGRAARQGRLHRPRRRRPREGGRRRRGGCAAWSPTTRACCWSARSRCSTASTRSAT